MRRLLAAAFLLLAAPAQAAWERPQAIDPGHGSHVRLAGDGQFVAYARGEQVDPSELLVSAGNEPIVRVKVPAAGRVVAFDVDRQGKLVALREARRGRRRVIAYEGNGWRAISSSATSAVDAKLAVAGSGAAVAAWLQYEGRRVFVHVAVRPPGARRFGAPERISGATFRIPQPLSLAVDDEGNAVVAFAERRDLYMWRSGQAAVRIHDTTEVTAGAFATTAAIRGQTALVAFTRLEDLEPPQYRATAATWQGLEPPAVETVAENVSAFDLAADVSSAGVPALLTTPIGPPYGIDVNLRAPAWSRTVTVPATEAPSSLAFGEGALAWTEGPKGFAWFSGQTLRLGDASSPDVDAADGRAIAAWNRGGGSNGQRLARFTP